MSTRFSSTSITFNDGTAQTTAAINAGTNTSGSNGAIFVDKVSNTLRFKTVTATGNAWTIQNSIRSAGEVQAIYLPGAPPGPIEGGGGD